MAGSKEHDRQQRPQETSGIGLNYFLLMRNRLGDHWSIAASFASFALAFFAAPFTVTALAAFLGALEAFLTLFGVLAAFAFLAALAFLGVAFLLLGVLAAFAFFGVAIVRVVFAPAPLFSGDVLDTLLACGGGVRGVLEYKI